MVPQSFSVLFSEYLLIYQSLLKYSSGYSITVSDERTIQLQKQIMLSTSHQNTDIYIYISKLAFLVKWL